MTYELIRTGGTNQTFTNREEYVRAYENQLRVESLRENAKGYVTEEVKLPEQLVLELSTGQEG